MPERNLSRSTSPSLEQRGLPFTVEGEEIDRLVNVLGDALGELD